MQESHRFQILQYQTNIKMLKYYILISQVKINSYKTKYRAHERHGYVVPDSVYGASAKIKET